MLLCGVETFGVGEQLPDFRGELTFGPHHPVVTHHPVPTR